MLGIGAGIDYALLLAARQQEELRAGHWPVESAYGVVVLAFQTATEAELLGVEELPVVPYVPLFMFAILFGLSTDYDVSCCHGSGRSGRATPTTAPRSPPPRRGPGGSSRRPAAS